MADEYRLTDDGWRDDDGNPAPWDQQAPALRKWVLPRVERLPGESLPAFRIRTGQEY